MTNSKWILVSLVGFGLTQSVGACSEDAHSSSSTNWLRCDDDEECAAVEGATCGREQICVDQQGAPIPVPSGAGGGSSGNGGSSAPSGGAPASTGGAASAGRASSGGGASSSGAAGTAGGTAGAFTAGAAGDSGVAGPGGSVGEGGTSAGGAAGSSALRCDASLGEDGYPLPDYDRSCEVDNDCFVGIHVLNCCGSVRYLAFNVRDEDAHREYAGACLEQAQCDCPSLAETEDGTRITKAGTEARCIDGVCRAECTAENCTFTDDCSAADECRTAGGGCMYIDPNLLIDLCRGADGSCGTCP